MRHQRTAAFSYRTSGAVPEPMTNFSALPRDEDSPRQWQRTLRALKGTALALAVVSATGAVYEVIASRGDAIRYPAPGQLVDLGGYRLHILCLGQGSPTVILDAGLGGTSLDWSTVQRRLSTRTRVCAYDRAGMGWSDPGPVPRSPFRMANELRRLLINAGEHGPYVLVAHSLSGKSARFFASANPGEVAGLVLADTRSERIDVSTTPTEAEAFATALKRQAVLLSITRRLGLVRLFGHFLADRPDLPPGAAGTMLLLQTQPKSLDATTEEGLARSADDEALSDASLGAIPLVVIAAGESNDRIPGWSAAQQALAALSTKGTLIVAEGSSHSVQDDQPEVVIDAVLSILGGAAGN